MTHKERFLKALDCRPVDRLPYGDGLWGETRAKYVEQGRLVTPRPLPAETMAPIHDAVPTQGMLG